jgi:hypothetical protein
VYRGYFASLEDILAEDAMSVSAWVCQGSVDDVQDRYVREEDTDDQRTDRCGYCGAVHTPRRRLLKDARPARARREQVTVQQVIIRSSYSYVTRMIRTPTA